MGGTLQQPPAGMFEISRRNSVMLHRSGILLLAIERMAMRCHDLRDIEPPSRASLLDCLRRWDEIFACFSPLPAGYRVVGKKTDSGPDFRLTRSRHPSASGRRIGPSAGDGWAARRDPEAHISALYWAGL